MQYSRRSLILNALVTLPFLIILGLAIWFARKANLESRQLDVKKMPTPQATTPHQPKK